MPKVDIIRRDGFQKQYVFPDRHLITIGRAESNDIFLADHDRVVSRYHAALVRLAGADRNRYFVRDLGSLQGTMVGGLPIYSQVLEEGDLIQIGDYQLVFSPGSERTTRLRHLKVAQMKTEDGPTEGSTRALKLPGPLRGASFTSERRELIEEIQRGAKQGLTSIEMANEILTALLGALQADQGLIGLLDIENPNDYEELTVVNVDEKEIIEVSDVEFGQRLLEGKILEENATVLAPIYDRDKVNGFFCVSRRDRQRHFSPEDLTFLVGLGKLVSIRCQKSEEGVRAVVKLTEVAEWPQGIIGTSEIVTELSKQVSSAAKSDMNVLISGETGSGKELVAKAIHKASAHGGGPFLAVNCPQTTEALAETEIFGYSPKSGISDSNPQGKPGWFELADGGTLFLDEIHSFSPSMQDKLLRVLQSQEVWRLGASTPLRVRVKVIAATDQPLDIAVEEGRVRAPFYYRFGIRIHVPPLCHRKEDIPLLAFYFVDKYASRLNSRTRTVSHRAVQHLMEYNWPGNVRQLESLIHSAVARNQEVLFSWDLPTEHRRTLSTTRGTPTSVSRIATQTATSNRDTPNVLKSINETEKEKIKEALEVTHGNITRAAAILGYRSRQTMLNKMDRYGISRDYADPKMIDKTCLGDSGELT